MLKNMKIGKRLIVAFLVVTIIASISGILGLYIFSIADTNYSGALANYGFASGKIGKLGMYINQGAGVTRDIVYQNDPAAMKEAQAQLEDILAKSNVALEEVRPTNTTAAGQELFAQIESDLATYRVIRDQVVAMGLANDDTGSHALWTAQGIPLVNKMATDIESLMTMKTSVGTDLSNSLSSNGQLMLVVMVAVIVAGIVIAILFAVYISRGISKPIDQVLHAAAEIAEGNLNVQIDFQSQDEVGMLAETFRKMSKNLQTIIEDVNYLLGEMGNGNFRVKSRYAEHYVGEYQGIMTAMRSINSNLSHTLSQINQASDQVSVGADQVSSGAQALSQGATEQASSVEELSATIAEISQQINQTAQRSQQAKSQSAHTETEIITSNQKMQDMIAAMADISGKSAEISKIIKAIEDIAFQTNILALNAAVEAARAGAAGKGFAVVADEVRNLAGKSAEAAKSTTALIEQTVAAVGNGTKIAADTAKALVGVVTGTQEVAALIGQISEAATEQANGAVQISTGIEQISSVVQTNSATSEESAAASEELSGQAQMLKDLVSQFKLKEETGIVAAVSGKHTDAREPQMAMSGSGSGSGFGSKY